jgi:hypothetical protein
MDQRMHPRDYDFLLSFTNCNAEAKNSLLVELPHWLYLIIATDYYFYQRLQPMDADSHALYR